MKEPYPTDAEPDGFLVQARLGDDVHDEAALVAVLGGRDAGDDFHRLHGVLANLIRIQTALLIGNRLVVDRELRLRMVADRMEEAVGVGHHAGRRERDHLVQTRATPAAASCR